MVSVGTYSAWDNTATLRLLGGARNACAPTERRGRGHIVAAARLQIVFGRFTFSLVHIFHHIYIYIVGEQGNKIRRRVGNLYEHD